MTCEITKDTTAVLDYGFDWSTWLQPGETIASAVLTVPTGITKDSQIVGSDSVLIWLSGGSAGATYKIDCKITTTNVPPRTDSRHIKIKMTDR